MGFIKTELYHRVVGRVPLPQIEPRLEQCGNLSTSRYWLGDKHSDIFLQRMNYVRENFLKEFQLKELAES